MTYNKKLINRFVLPGGLKQCNQFMDVCFIPATKDLPAKISLEIHAPDKSGRMSTRSHRIERIGECMNLLICIGQAAKMLVYSKEDDLYGKELYQYLAQEIVKNFKGELSEDGKG